MIILGINAFGHDAAAVLLIDGETVFAASQERFDRQRHSAAFPAEAILAALEHASVAPEAVDAVAFPWTRGMGRLSKAWHVVKGWPRTRAYFTEPPDHHLPSRQGYLRNMREVASWLDRGILGGLGLRAPLVRVPHHEAHAASAMLGLPAEAPALVLTADGMGEWTTTATWDVASGRPRRRRRAVYPHSAGKAYAAVTQWLGFWPESDEGKTMGLAAYGREDTDGYRFARSLLRHDARRLLRVRTKAFDFPHGAGRLYGDAFLEALGPARASDAPLRDGDADVALGMQHAIEEAMLSVAREGLAATGASHLGLAGGLFLNCAMNGVLARRLDAEVHPFPVAGDAGAAWGAAAAVHRARTGERPAPLRTLRLGSPVRATEADALAQMHEGHRADDPAATLVDALRADRIVAVARGRAEFGPRALGGRSVVALPRSVAMRDEVNRRKGREAWRPLAPIVRVEDRRWFELEGPSPFMITTGLATDAARARTPGVVHEDGTARVQTVGPEDDPFLREVLDRLEAEGEPPVLLNTSLNRRGEPIVDTAEEAYTAAASMGVDAVLLDDCWLPLAR